MRLSSALALVLVLVLVLVLEPSLAADTPSDDPAAWDTVLLPGDPTLPAISAPRFVVPSPALPARSAPLASNNNCAIAFHGGRLYLAWRTAPIHFASPAARLEIVSSPDRGRTFEYEHTVALGADVREPTFISLGGRLILQFFELGTDPFAFEPRRMLRTVREGPGRRTAPDPFGGPGPVPWDVKVRGGRALMTSYRGAHYALAGGTIDVFFETSPDGLAWTPVDPANPVVYRGGVSEVAFEIERSGALLAVTRNEDGDATGFGSHVATAAPGALGRWSFPPASNPERYDSPELFRHGDDLYLVARRDVGGPFDMGLGALPFAVRRGLYLASYAARPKGTALYRIDRSGPWPAPARVLDLPGNGDTAFPSVARTGPHSFLLANYTSPLGNPDGTWMHGQVSPRGTQIYLLDIEFAGRP